MAQIREFESTTESYFILDGVSYPKVYEAMLDNGYSDTKIKLVGTNRDTTPLVFSTQYTNIRVDGDSFDTALEAISRLNQIVFSKGGGSGTGVATNVITEDSDTVAFTGNGTAGNPLSAKGYNGSYSTTETLTGGTWIDGKPIYRKVIEGLLGTLGESSVEFIGADAIDVVISKFIYTRGNNGLSDIEFAEDGFTHLAVRYDNINQSFNIISKPDKAGNTYYLTVEYTKISDVAP